MLERKDTREQVETSTQWDRSSQQLWVLVVEDDRKLRDLICLILQKGGYKPIPACNGWEALELLNTHEVDLVLLDVMMPDLDGFQVCAQIRKHSDVPIVMLTALYQPDDIVNGLYMGADDFISKPVALRELLARLEAVLRRTTSQRSARSNEPVPPLGKMTLEPRRNSFQVIVSGRVVQLTRLEFLLLEYLMLRSGEAVNKEELLEAVWNYPPDGDTNIVEVCMSRLRTKIEQDPSNPIYLTTVRGSGYKFDVPEQALVQRREFFRFDVRPKPESDSDPRGIIPELR